MFTIAELKARREAAGARLIAMRDECMKDGFKETEAWASAWDKANDEYNDALKAEEDAIAENKRKAARVAIGDTIRANAERLDREGHNLLRPDYNPNRDPRSRGGASGPTAQDWRQGLRVWASRSRPDFVLGDEDGAVLRRCGINLHSNEMVLPTSREQILLTAEFQDAFIQHHPQHRARAMRQALASMNTMTPESGAYATVPPTIIRQLEINKLAFGGLLQVATIRTTGTGEDILLPFSDDTTTMGVRISEDGPLGTELNPRFGQIKWGSYKYSSRPMAVTHEMTRDSFFDLETFLGDTGGMRLGRIENRECTLGTGNSMPRGIVFCAPVGVTTASASAITTDEVIDLEMSVDDAYKNGDRVGFMMNKNVLKYLRKLKDGEGRPFYILGQETGGRDQLNGKPIFINYDMADVAASADVMLYGDYSKYWVRRVGGSRVVRDPYTKLMSNDVELYAVVEYLDGNLVNTGTAPVKKMRMHA